MEQQKYSVLLVNEEKLLEGGFFKEVKGAGATLYSEIEAKCSNIIRWLCRERVEIEIYIDELNYQWSNLGEAISRKEKEFDSFIKLCAEKLYVQVDFLRMLVMMYIAKEKGNEQEKEYASKVDFLNDIVEIKELADKYLEVVTMQNKFEFCNSEKGQWNRNLEKVKLFMDMYKHTLGFHFAFIIGDNINGVRQEINTFYEEMSKITETSFEFDKIFNIINNTNITTDDLSARAFNLIRRKRNSSVIDNEAMKKIIQYIDDCIEWINVTNKAKKALEEATSEEAKKKIKEENPFADIDIRENIDIVKKSLLLIERKSKEYIASYEKVARKYNINVSFFLKKKRNFENKLQEVREHIANLDNGIDGINVVDLGELKECCENINFKEIKEVVDGLQLQIKKLERDNIIIDRNSPKIKYGEYKSAFQQVWMKALDEFYNKLYLNNRMLAEEFKDKEKIRRKIKKIIEEEKESTNPTNRFFAMVENDSVAIMTYSYPGMHDSEYKRGAIIFDADKVNLIISESKKSGWNMKESRGGTGSDKFGNGQYLLAAGNKKILMCELFQKKDKDGKINKYENSDISKIKEEANYYNREGSLFDFREKRVIEMDKPQRVDAKSYGKLGVITEETAEQLVNFNWHEKKEGAGVLYIDSAEELSNYILSL